MPSDGPNAPAANEPLPELKFLKTLVTVLAGTMIVGLITVIALLVIRLGPQNTPRVTLPDRITLPQGTAARSVSVSERRTVILTDDDQVLVYDAQGTLIGTTHLIPAP